LKKFIQSVTIRNKGTVVQYECRLSFFERFLKEKYKVNLDELIKKIKFATAEYDSYDILNNYCIFLQNNYNKRSSFRDKIITVKTFLEYNDIEINPKKSQIKSKISKNCIEI
jgi:hypothetical protein